MEASERVEEPAGARLVLRHRLSTRIWHWVNALTVFVMLMSGLMIFNAHPRLYWGQYGANADPAWLEIGSTESEGFLEIGTVRIPTTGVLGHWTDSEGAVQRRAFPGWATIPSRYNLASARNWHLAFAWLFGICLITYWIAGLANRHIRRDILPRAEELSPRHIGREISDHLRLRFPKGEAALRYNSLQKLAYSGIVILVLPLLLLSGLGMSPAIDAAWPWIVDLLGGRQSARSVHFLCATAMLLFIFIHLTMVLVAGPINHIRAMITGRFRLASTPGERPVE